ncbi:MAG: hypothetical protein JWR04_1219 [Rhodoglobus sp.]|nr:hypothetical protein [Rhodoglobus sp.]
MVADQLNSVSVGRSSTVFGLVGPWGSGKTSVLNMVRQSLSADWNIADFSPWAAPDSKGLAFEFLASLASAIRPSDQKARAWKKSIASYAQLGTPFLDLVPVVGLFASRSVDRALGMVAGGKPWKAEFDAVSKLTKDLGKRVLIIADDIDRLDSEELLGFLKVVRLLGRFPNVHYLIAYDQGTIEDLLNSQQVHGQRASFMEKIVQYPFELPAMAAVDRRRMAREALESVLLSKRITLSDDDQARASELIGILGPAMTTPRSHARFGEQLLAYSSTVNFREVDFLDFAALTYIRVVEHALFDSIPGWEQELRTSTRTADVFEAQKIKEAEWIDRVGKGAVADLKAAMKILSFLFPSITYEGLTYHADHVRGLNEEKYFERYFVLGIASNDVEDELVEQALVDLADGEDGSEAVQGLASKLDAASPDLAALAYEKSLEFRRSSTSTARELVEFLFARLQKRRGEEASFGSPAAVLWRWVAHEIGLGLVGGVLQPARVEEALGEDGTMQFLLQHNRDRSVSKEERAKILGMFVPPFERRVKDDPAGLLKEQKLRISLALLAKVNGTASINGVLDRALRATPGLFAEVVEAFVWVQEWVGAGGVSPELTFDEELYTASVSAELRRELVVTLPTADLEHVDDEDLSPENRERFAMAAARRVG